MTFTAEELEIMAAALNHYFCDQVELSKTWGQPYAIRNGQKDIYERHCDTLLDLQAKTYKAQQRLKK